MYNCRPCGNQCRDNKVGSTLVNNEHVKNAHATKSLAVFFAFACNLPLFIREKATTCGWKVKIDKTQYFISLRAFPFRLIIPRFPLTGYASLVVCSFPIPSSLPPYLRPWVAPYFKRHISRDHASSASKMSMPPAGFATATSHGAGPPWQRDIVSLSRLAANYTLMRRRVIRRRCTKWKWWGTRGWSERPVEVSFGNILAFRYSQLT